MSEEEKYDFYVDGALRQLAETAKTLSYGKNDLANALRCLADLAQNSKRIIYFPEYPTEPQKP